MRYPFRIVLLSLLSFSAAFAQSSAINGQILGTVTDPSGATIVGATVRATNANTGFQQTVQTLTDGLYRFNVLPLGEYEVTVDAAGFATAKRTGIILNAGAVVTADIPLQVKSVGTEVIISAAGAVIDPSRTDTGSTLSGNAIVNLPLLSRNPYNFILQQPNVSGRGNTEFGVPRKINANGFAGRINYQLDGSNNVQSDRAGIRLLPISNTWVEEVQAVSNGFAPEFGNTVGTVFNTITKSGSNDLHGEGGYIFRRTPFSARPALLRDSQPTPDVNVDAFFANAGGRVVKDKLFWFGAVEKVKRDLPTTVGVSADTVSQLGLPASYANAIPFSQNVWFYMGKADWQINQANRLSVRYNMHRNDSPYNNGGGLVLVDRTYNFVDRSFAGAVQLISIVSPRAVNELRFQIPYRTQQQNRFEATGTGPAITIPGVASFGNSLDVGFAYNEMTPEVSENFSYNLSTHSLKFGGSLRSIRDTQVASTSANYTFPSIAAYLAAKAGTAPLGYSQFAQTVGNPAIDYNSLFTGLYAQDAWKPRPNLTITYGLRYDIYRPPAANAQSPFAYSQSFRTDKNNVAPRLGVALGLGKWVVRASGGIFYDPFQTDTYRKSLLNNGTGIFFGLTTTPTTPYAPSFPNVLLGIPTNYPLGIQDVTTVSPDFATLYSINGNVSVSRELGWNTALTATYLYTRGNRLPVWRNINLVPGGTFLADGRPIFGSDRVFPAYNNLYSAESVGQSTYNGLNIRLERRFAKNFSLLGYYTWSHTIDDAPEQNNIDSATFWLSDQTNRRRDRGNSLIDRRHAFNGNAIWNPTFNSSSKAWNYIANNNRFAVAILMQSGETANIGSNRVLNGDTSSSPQAFQRPLYIGRNTLNTPALYEFNVRYSRIFPIKERLFPEFFAETTNIFNHTNVTGINSTATVDAAGNVLTAPSQAWTSAMDQRLLQFGIKLVF